MPRVSEVLSGQADGYPFAEDTIRTTCPSCERVQTLDEAIFDESNPQEAKYLCAGCMEVILVVGRPEVPRPEGRGYELGDWVLRNPNDVVVEKTHTGRPLRFVASPHALD